MHQNKLRTAELARLTGLNRRALPAPRRNTATRIEPSAIYRLCAIFDCEVGERFERVRETSGGTE